MTGVFKAAVVTVLATAAGWMHQREAGRMCELA